MCSTTQAGLDFVQGLMRDIHSLKEQVGQLHGQLAQEQKSVKEAMLVLENQMSMRVLREEHQNLIERIGGLDTELKQSFADVAAERDSMKMKFSNIDEILGVSREEQMAVNARVGHLERDRDEKTPVIDQIGARTTQLENGVATKVGSHDFRAALGRLQELETAMGERATRNDLFQLTTTVQGLEDGLMQRSSVADVRALDLKMRNCEASLESVQAELSRKAVKVDLDARAEALQEALDKMKTSMKDHFGHLDKEINDTRKTSNSATELLGRDMQALQHAMGHDGEHVAARFAAVDKEMNTKASLADAADLTNRLCTIEHSLPPLERTLGVVERSLGNKADVTDTRSSVEALENAVATKANHSDLLRACLGLEDQVTKMDAVSSRVELCERSLEGKASVVEFGSLLRRHEVIQSQTSTWQTAVTDLDTVQVFLWGPSKQPERSADSLGGALTKRMSMAEFRIEDLNRLTERKADIDEMRQRLANKADLEHCHDRIVSVDGKTTFAI